MEQIKEMLSQLTLFVRTMHAFSLELEEQDKRIKALEENRKLKDGAITRLEKDVSTLKLLARKKVQ